MSVFCDVLSLLSISWTLSVVTDLQVYTVVYLIVFYHAYISEVFPDFSLYKSVERCAVTRLNS